MGLFKRVNDIISANLNELVDSFEDPEKMLRQAVREMETAIGKAMDGAAKVIANEKRLTKQLADLQTQAEHWKSRAVVAVQNSDDETARHALVRKEEVEKLVAALDDQRVAAQSSAQKLRRQIDAMRVRLAEARRKAITLSARKQAAEARKILVSDISAASIDQSAFGRFDRICDNIEQSEAEAEALFELSGFELFDDVETEINPGIEVELTELKKAYATVSEN